MGQTAVKLFFPADNTHTNADGAKLNAETVANELKRINPGKIKKYMN
jgi:lysophospholipase L1-like esterase